MIEASQIKVDPHVAATVKRNQKMSRTKEGSTQNYILAVDQNGRPIRAIIRAGTTADCCQAESLRPGIRLSIYWQIGVMRLFFKQPIRLRCGPLLRPRKMENIREMTTKIDTKCGIESKMLSGILNGGVESP